MTLFELRRAHEPDVILHFGVSRFARGLQLETVARNVCGACEDACGAVPGQANIVAGAPMSLNATYPVEAIRSGLVGAGIPHSTSDDAGTYLCNSLLFRSLLAEGSGNGCETSGAGRRPLVGFIHLPDDLGGSGCELTWRAALRGGLIAARTCMDQVRSQG